MGPASHSSGPKKQVAGGQAEGPPQPDTPTPSVRMASVTGTPAAGAIGPRAMELVPLHASVSSSVQQGWRQFLLSCGVHGVGGECKACGTAPARHLLLQVVSVIMLVTASGSFLLVLFQFHPPS